MLQFYYGSPKNLAMRGRTLMPTWNSCTASGRSAIVPFKILKAVFTVLWMVPSFGCLPAAAIVLSCSKTSALSSSFRVWSVSIAVWS